MSRATLIASICLAATAGCSAAETSTVEGALVNCLPHDGTYCPSKGDLEAAYYDKALAEQEVPQALLDALTTVCGDPTDCVLYQRRDESGQRSVYAVDVWDSYMALDAGYAPPEAVELSALTGLPKGQLVAIHAGMRAREQRPADLSYGRRLLMRNIENGQDNPWGATLVYLDRDFDYVDWQPPYGVEDFEMISYVGATNGSWWDSPAMAYDAVIDSTGTMAAYVTDEANAENIHVVDIDMVTSNASDRGAGRRVVTAQANGAFGHTYAQKQPTFAPNSRALVFFSTYGAQLQGHLELYLNEGSVDFDRYNPSASPFTFASGNRLTAFEGLGTNGNNGQAIRRHLTPLTNAITTDHDANPVWFKGAAYTDIGYRD